MSESEYDREDRAWNEKDLKVEADRLVSSSERIFIIQNFRIIKFGDSCDNTNLEIFAESSYLNMKIALPRNINIIQC